MKNPRDSRRTCWSGRIRQSRAVSISRYFEQLSRDGGSNGIAALELLERYQVLSKRGKERVDATWGISRKVVELRGGRGGGGTQPGQGPRPTRRWKRWLRAALSFNDSRRTPVTAGSKGQTLRKLLESERSRGHHSFPMPVHAVARFQRSRHHRNLLPREYRACPRAASR